MTDSGLTNNLHNEPNLSLRISCFNDILIFATTIHVEKPKPSEKSKPWMTPHVPAKLRTWNRLRPTIHEKRQKWIKACREATEAFNKAKTDGWKDLLQGAMLNSNGTNIWKVIQGLNGTPCGNSPDETMPHNGYSTTNIKSKANVSINYYVGISKLNMSRVNWDLDQLMTGLLTASADDETCASLQMGEVLSAIKKSLPYFICKVVIQFPRSLT